MKQWFILGLCLISALVQAQTGPVYRKTTRTGDVYSSDSVSVPLKGLRQYLTPQKQIRFIGDDGVRRSAGQVFGLGIAVSSGSSATAVVTNFAQITGSLPANRVTGLGPVATSNDFRDLGFRPLEYPSSFSLVSGQLPAGRLSNLSLINLSALSNDAGYQTAAQLAQAVTTGTAGLVTTSTYNTNRAFDQNSVTAAQNQANTATTIANSATTVNAAQQTAIDGKLPIVTYNGYVVSQDQRDDGQDAQLATKANQASTYTKAEVDTKLASVTAASGSSAGRDSVYIQLGNSTTVVKYYVLRSAVNPPAPTVFSDSVSAWYAFSGADSTRSRVDETAMTSLTITSAASFQTLLNSSITNKRIVVQGKLNAGTNSPVWGFTPKAPWTNVLVVMADTASGLYNTAWTQVMAWVENLNHSRVEFRGVKMWQEYTGTNSNDAVFRCNEITRFDGLCLNRCEIFSKSFTSPNVNLFTINQYSESNPSGSKISENVLVKDCFLHDGARMGTEVTGNAVGSYRIKNIVYVRNRHERLGKNNIYGMASSFTDGVINFYHAFNTSLESKKIAYEFVNCRRGYARENQAASFVNESAAYGASDNNKGNTDSLIVSGGTFTMTERPFYFYDSHYIRVYGGTYTTGAGVDMKVTNSTFKGVTINHRNRYAGQNSWVVDSPSANNVFDGLTIDNTGSTGFTGAQGSYNAFVLNAGTTGNLVKNMVTTVGRMNNGAYHNPAAQVVNNSTATPSNTIQTSTNTATWGN